MKEKICICGARFKKRVNLACPECGLLIVARDDLRQSIDGTYGLFLLLEKLKGRVGALPCNDTEVSLYVYNVEKRGAARYGWVTYPSTLRPVEMQTLNIWQAYNAGEMVAPDLSRFAGDDERAVYARRFLKRHTREAGFEVVDCSQHGETLEVECLECRISLIPEIMRRQDAAYREVEGLTGTDELRLMRYKAPHCINCFVTLTPEQRYHERCSHCKTCVANMRDMDASRHAERIGSGWATC